VEHREDKIQMGGQAVIEGVMMRSPTGYCIAVRKKDKSIKLKSVPYSPLTRRIKILGLPFLRGVVTLFEMLVIGLKGLDFSVNEWEGDHPKEKEGKKAEEPETEAKANPPNPGSPQKDEKNTIPEPKRQISLPAMVGLMTFSLALALVLTVVLPNILTHLAGKVFTLGKAKEILNAGPGGLVEERSPLLYNLIAGFFRAVILVTYIWVISLSRDIRRVFEYHGAEHKAVFAFEDAKPLTLENIRPYSTRHPRCGTTFLGVVIIISIIIFAFIAWLVTLVYPPFHGLKLVFRKMIIMALHIVFMPLVAGISYEIIKYGSKHLDNPLTRLLTYPGLLSQHITTRKPDDEQLEVSIASLEGAMAISPGQKEPILSVLSPNHAPD